VEEAEGGDVHAAWVRGQTQQVMGLGSVLLSEEWFIIIIDVVVDSGGRNCCTFDPDSSFMACQRAISS
jgi:hypothetical protein